MVNGASYTIVVIDNLRAHQLAARVSALAVLTVSGIQDMFPYDRNPLKRGNRRQNHE
jgi:hypothetical protein